MGDYLRAIASYTDEEGSGKSAQAISANAVEGAPGRNAPVFTEAPTATRSVPSNTPAGRNIGAPVAATDADNDALTYSLGGPDEEVLQHRHVLRPIVDQSPIGPRVQDQLHRLRIGQR